MKDLQYPRWETRDLKEWCSATDVMDTSPDCDTARFGTMDDAPRDKLEYDLVCVLLVSCVSCASCAFFVRMRVVCLVCIGRRV